MEFIEKNKLTLIASCDKILDMSLDAIEQLQVEFPEAPPENILTIDDFKKTVQRTEVVKKKIINGEDFTKDEFIILGIIMNSNLSILSMNEQRFAHATKLMQELIAEYVQILEVF